MVSDQIGSITAFHSLFNICQSCQKVWKFSGYMLLIIIRFLCANIEIRNISSILVHD